MIRPYSYQLIIHLNQSIVTFNHKSKTTIFLPNFCFKFQLCLKILFHIFLNYFLFCPFRLLPPNLLSKNGDITIFIVQLGTTTSNIHLKRQIYPFSFHIQLASPLLKRQICHFKCISDVDVSN